MRSSWSLCAVFCLLFTALSTSASGQNNRINTHETIGWYNVFGTFKLSNKIGLHTEYQWRRDNLITDWQQSLLRVGVNYQYSPRVLFRAGYAWAETFPYGDIPINGLGKAFAERRIFEMAQLSQKEGIVDITHRFMLEQRFVGRFASAQSTTEDEFLFMNRMRYMARVQVPLFPKRTKNPYIALYDEVLVGFGKNVGANVFDQNRLSILLGYAFNKTFRLEGGYLNQILQFGREINGRNVFQYNNGLIVNANFTFDLSEHRELQLSVKEAP